MFCTAPDVANSLAAALKVPDLGSAAPYWATIIQAAQQSAYQDIYRSLIRRGFAPAQIAAWDAGPEFERHLTVFWSLVNGGALQDYSEQFIKMIDRRPELPNVEVYNAGIWQAPLQPAPGQAFVSYQSVVNPGFCPPINGSGNCGGNNNDGYNCDNNGYGYGCG